MKGKRDDGSDDRISATTGELCVVRRYKRGMPKDSSTTAAGPSARILLIDRPLFQVVMSTLVALIALVRLRQALRMDDGWEVGLAAGS